METMVLQSSDISDMLQPNWGQKLRQGADVGHVGKPKERIL